MKVLFTGSSSFTGYWFVKTLAEAGHEVTAVFSAPLENYSGLRRERVDLLIDKCTPIFNCEMGSALFMRLIEDQNFDLFCHHAADVTNYKSPDFDTLAAVAKNTRNLSEVLKKLSEKGCKKVQLTGSVFEQDEGIGETRRAFSPYGLSKGITAEIFRYYSEILELKLGKFVIPNPFGPYEEPRFTAYLMKTWAEGKTADVSSPDYIRDNIPVDLLAKAYVRFAERLDSKPGYEKFNPSYFADKQGAFTLVLAKEMQKRLQWPCNVHFADQKLFPEPKKRINSDKLLPGDYGWSESAFWDSFADYYRKVLI